MYGHLTPVSNNENHEYDMDADPGKTAEKMLCNASSVTSVLGRCVCLFLRRRANDLST